VKTQRCIEKGTAIQIINLTAMCGTSVVLEGGGRKYGLPVVLDKGNNLKCIIILILMEQFATQGRNIITIVTICILSSLHDGDIE
jgi:hypothetical protein